MSDPPLLIARDAGVVTATLNRPARRNAMDAAMAAALDSLLADLAAADPGAPDAPRILVLRGAGGAFCAGLDLEEVAADAALPDPIGAGLARNRAIAARFAAIAALPQVVVALAEGACFAGGLGLLCAADLAIAGPGARFAAPEARRGLVPAQILPWLARRMGAQAAARFCLLGTALDAAGALAAGLVDEVGPGPEDTLAATLAALRQGAPGALAETKRLAAAMRPVAPPAYAEAAAAAFARCAAGPEAAEGIAAFRARRAPRWAGPG